MYILSICLRKEKRYLEGCAQTILVFDRTAQVIRRGPFLSVIGCAFP
jgi:hypothetical protein